MVADRSAPASMILAVGSIKWFERAPFDGRDLSRLLVHRGRLPSAGDDTHLVVISRSGCTVDGVATYDAADLLHG